MSKLLLVIFPIIIFLSSALPVQAQQFIPPKERYFKAAVVRIIDEGEKEIAGQRNKFQVVEVKDAESTETVRIETIGAEKTWSQKELKENQRVIVLELTDQNGQKTYSIWDKYRLDVTGFAIILFFILVIVAAGLKGVGSIAGMLVSLGVLMTFIVPQILKGGDPVLISVLGALVIMVVTIYLAHGVSKRTSVAVFSTFLSLVIVGVLATVFVKFLSLSGLGDETNYSLQFGVSNINLRGLLLGGIIIGALGVLDDITTTQAAAVFELKKVAKNLSFKELLIRGYNVGREHVTSLVNTLLLAYAGSSLSIFLLFELNPGKTPWWVILNSEIIIEEVVRTLAGSVGLVLAVPITTLIAAYVATRKTSG